MSLPKTALARPFCA
uniref:Uncharacterized protein n=1 Tax=Anguilla anguilla TaxID=7936 RepID=A0A0E9UC38_ANGAN